MVCLVGMEGSRDVEPLREVQRMSWRLAINSIGSRSTGSGEGDPERWGEGKSKQRKRREWKRGGITGRDMRRRWRGVKGHTVIAHLNACNYSKQACKTNEGWNSTLINCILGLCCTFCVHVLTIFGFAGAVIWLQQVSLHTAAGVGALSVCARLTARPIHIALIEIYKKITLCITISFYWVCFDTTFLVLGNKRERLLLNLITNIYLLPWGKCFDKKMTCCCTQVPVSKHKSQSNQMILWVLLWPSSNKSGKSPTHLYMSFHLQQPHSRCYSSTEAHHESQHSETGTHGRYSLVRVLRHRKTERSREH